MFTHMKRMIRQAFVSLSSSDSETHPQAQLTNNKKAYNAIRINPYGVCSNPPRNSIALVFAPSYNGEDTKYAIINDHIRRFKGLHEGEVIVGNYLTKAHIFFDEDGNLNINVPDGNLVANVSGTTDITSGGAMTITAPTVTIKTNSFNVESPDGDATTSSFKGNISTTSGDITADNVSLKTHVHGNVESGNDETGQPQ